MKKYIFLCLLFFFPACFVSQTREGGIERARLHYDAGLKYLQQNSLGEAKAEFSKAVLEDPDHPDYYNVLGLTYSKLTDYEEACKNFKKALKLNPDFSEARNGLASTLAILKRVDEAISEWKKVLADPTYRFPETIHFNIANAHLDSGNLDSATEHYNAVLKFFPDHLMSHFNLGRIYEKNGKYDLACEEYKKSVTIDKAFVPAHFGLGENYFKLKKEKEAIEEFEMVLVLDPNSGFGEEAKKYLDKLK